MDLRDVHWRKSSHSSKNGACVEVAPNLSGVVGIRDSKNVHGPALLIPRASFAASVSVLKARQR